MAADRRRVATRTDDTPAAVTKHQNSRTAKAESSRVAPTAAENRKSSTSTSKKPAAKKPYGREEVIESIISATLSLWSAKGPAELSLRSIAAEAGVNYGLVYRHFRTKDAVIRAAMERVVARSTEIISESEDVEAAVREILPRSTGAHARLLAWATLQSILDEVLPEKDSFLERMVELARDAERDAKSPEPAIKVGSVIAMLYGWRLFEPYLVRGLGLGRISHARLDRYIQQDILRVLGVGENGQ
jgi:AcrR family transcriptional regulator